MQSTQPACGDARGHSPHEQRIIGCSTAASTRSADAPSWLKLSAFAMQLSETTTNSLSAFSLAVSDHYYTSTNVDIRTRKGHSLGQLDKLKFWQTDLLAGLLMQAFMFAACQLKAKSHMLQRLSTFSNSIEFASQGLQDDLVLVPGMNTSCPGTEWMCLFWNFLRTVVDWRYPDPEAEGVAALSSLTTLQTQLCASFADQAKASKASKARAVFTKRFWQQDCLAAALFEAVADYVSSGQAVQDGDAIQEWLCACSHSKSTQPSAGLPLPAPKEDTTQVHPHGDGHEAPGQEAVDASTLHAAISELGEACSIAALARLEDRLVKHFQVSTLLCKTCNQHGCQWQHLHMAPCIWQIPWPLHAAFQHAAWHCAGVLLGIVVPACSC